jgi:hypothetical protein
MKMFSNVAGEVMTNGPKQADLCPSWTYAKVITSRKAYFTGVNFPLTFHLDFSCWGWKVLKCLADKITCVFLVNTYTIY